MSLPLLHAVFKTHVRLSRQSNIIVYNINNRPLAAEGAYYYDFCCLRLTCSLTKHFPLLKWSEN